MPYRLAIALCRLLDEVYTIFSHFAIPNLKKIKKVYKIGTIQQKARPHPPFFVIAASSYLKNERNDISNDYTSKIRSP